MAKELDVRLDTTDFEALGKALAERLGPGNKARNVFNIHMAAAFKNAMKKPASILKQKTSRGPTGNLRRSVQSVFRNYKRDRKWFGAIGYSVSGQKTKIHKDGYRTGANLGYHQGLVEFGTKNRRTNGRIASSISRFTSVSVSNTRTGAIRTQPKPPKGFFKSAPAGSTVDLGRMEGQGKIPETFLTAQTYMEAGLRDDIEGKPGDKTRGRVNKAWAQLNYDYSKKLKKR